MLGDCLSSDPFGTAKQEMGTELVDKILERLSVFDCIELALKKLEPDTRETSLAITKLQEAELWLKQDNKERRTKKS